MERRREVRLTPLQTIEATVLRGGREPVAGTVLDMSGRGVCLRLPGPVTPGAAIQVEAGDMMLLGEVRYCEPVQDAFRVGIDIRHTLTRLAELRAWNRRMKKEQVASEPVRS